MTRQTPKLLPLCLVLLSGCGKEKQVPLTQQTPGDRSGAIGSADPLNGNGQRLEPGTKFARASAKLEAANGSKLGGDAGLEEVTSGVRIRVSVHDAKPNTKLGVHVLEKSDCANLSNDDAGAHLNPRHARHGLPGGEQHLGDLGNVTVDDKGNGELLILTSGGNLHAGDAHSFLNRALVVDESEDQGKPEASGGKPALCGVIKE
jgi:Cu-Zn family superoxide dismutase